ncbi:uncharacterized protein LOC141595577 [Silene latifolia]|uniref:uncharacterized protein LOC141595577 n=1 Tax=Silene latifolia TaxID=37657 RepID=UPI003D77EF1A
MDVPDTEEPEETQPQSLLRLTKEDVAGEISFWSTSVYCYVLGANPPSNVITGFLKRVWQAYGVDRVSFLPNGIFLVRFKSKEHQQMVLKNGHLQFDNKPVIINEWKPDSELLKHDVSRIPLWMKIYGLDIKFWGANCLKKICGGVGSFIRCDEATANKAFLGYARLMVEVTIGQTFPTELQFIDENDNIQKVRVVYDWLPTTCSSCQGMGYTEDRTQQPKHVPPQVPQRPKKVVAQTAKEPSPPQRVQTPVVVRRTAPITDSVPVVEHHHKGGRIWLIWEPSMFCVDVKDVTAQSIHVEVTDRGRGCTYWMTLVYGFNKAADRDSLWGKLRTYASLINGPWLVCGDINAIMANDERIGGASITSAEIRPMVNAMFDCNFCANFLPEGLFDHCPCLINLDVVGDKKKAPFKYFNMWSMAEGFEDVTKLRADPLNVELCNAERICAQEVVFLTKARMDFLKQKAKVAWVKEGDASTFFFHASIKRMRGRNRVYQIKDMHGRLCTKSEDIKAAFEEYYVSLLGTSNQEIRLAMFDILGTKAPGPDGFSSQFFKDSWNVVGKDVIKAIQSVFRSGQLLKQCNNTLITLVPKMEIHKNVLQFRPIACCNTIYKCLSKVICNRLSKILPDLVSPSQSAFIRGRDIVGNILICQDLIRLYKRKSCSPRMMMKLDMQKAYDSIEWSFVEEMLRALDFPELMVSLLMQCVTTPSYSIALNGEVFGFFKGQRGLRQGDQLSPLLFTLCLEYLSRILLTTQKMQNFRFHPLCKRIGLTHLCFADDLILFCKGDRASIELMINAFHFFSKASGLKLNKGKSNFYANGVDEGILKEVETVIGMCRGSVPFKYLGVTVSPKRISIGAWAPDISLMLGELEPGSSPALVAWEKVCSSKKHGGLGLKNLHYWNCAAVGKYVWWIENKEDHLRVKWVHVIYIKGKVWKDYSPPINSSWAWRKICQTKNILKDSIWDQNISYSIKRGYEWLVPANPTVPWYRWSLNNWIMHKHGFICWLAAQGHLLTQDRLNMMLITQTNCCYLCVPRSPLFTLVDKVEMQEYMSEEDNWNDPGCFNLSLVDG